MKGLTDVRRYADYAKSRNELIEVNAPVDTTYELAGIVKAMEGGPPVLFNNIIGYPGQRVLSNVFGNRQRLAAMLGTTPAYTGQRFLESVRNPVRPEICHAASSQENLITSDIDLLKLLPVPKQTATDSGRLITGGMVIMQLPGREDFNISYHRMVVVGPNLTTMAIEPSRHLMQAINEVRKTISRVPVTVCVGASPAVMLAACSASRPASTPYGYDELWAAGSLQGAAVRVVPAKVVQGAYALADAEWVLEGFIYPGEFEFEDPERCTVGTDPCMPEWNGYVGKAWRTYKFEVSAVTHRNDPIYYFPVADSLETVNLFAIGSEAAVFDSCSRIGGSAFDTCYSLPSMRGNLGIVIRMDKSRQRDEGSQINMMNAAMGAHWDLQWVVVVDKDVEITDANDVLWAMLTRLNPRDGMWTTSKSKIPELVKYKACFDATIPYEHRREFFRAEFPEVDLGRWLSSEQIGRIREQQDDYSRFIASARR